MPIYMHKITEEELKEKILKIVSDCGSQKEAAKYMGVSLSYLNDYLSGRREAGGKILSALEVKRVLYYESTAKFRDTQE